MNENYNEIIISSGGVRGIALLGSLKSFYKIYPIERITHFTGCSVGALFCLLLEIGINHLQEAQERSYANAILINESISKYDNILI